MSTVLRQVASIASRTCKFSSSALTRKDIVQDIYIREINSYKPAPAVKDAHVGIVKRLSLPPSPQAPMLPTDLASELAAYDAAEPVLATSSAIPEANKMSEGAGGAEGFLVFLEQDLPKPVHAHH